MVEQQAGLLGKMLGAGPTAGDNLAAGLCDAAAVASPSEDVDLYLQQSILPCLGPAIEQLLQHLHKSGELQRALREKAEAERQQQRLEAKAARKADAIARGELTSDRESVASPMESPTAGSMSRPPISRSTSTFSATPKEDLEEEDVEEEGLRGFEPLAWLAERLQQAAASPPGQYREQVEQLVRAKLEEEAAAAIAAAAVASAVAAGGGCGHGAPGKGTGGGGGTAADGEEGEPGDES